MSTIFKFDLFRDVFLSVANLAIDITVTNFELVVTNFGLLFFRMIDF